MEQHLVEQITVLVVVGVVVVGAVSWFAGRIGVAAPLLLTVVGIGLGFVPGAAEVSVDPEVILTVVLPPLLYAAALKVPIVDFRRNLRVIAFLSVVLVVVSAAAVGALVWWLWPAVGWALALALGAVVGPPDAVAATSIGKRLGLPPRVLTILEGEGLVNDATALVLLSTAVGIADGTSTADGFTSGFVWALVAAVLGGWAIGSVAVLLRARTTDVVLDTTLSLVVPFVAFVVAEQLGASGVVAVVVAGMVVGNTGGFRIGARQRQSERGNWETVTMLLENGVFLYMGLRLHPVLEDVAVSDSATWEVVGVGVAVTLLLVLVRFAMMPVLLWQIRRRARRLERHQRRGRDRMHRARKYFGDAPDERVVTRLEMFRARLERGHHDVTAERDQILGWRDGAVLGWAGMRGVVTVAAVQTLPADHPYYSALVLVAFVVAMLTLVSQGLSLPALVRRLRLTRDASDEERTEYLALVQRVQAAGDRTVDEAVASQQVPPEVEQELRSWSRGRVGRTQLWADTDPDDEDAALAQFQRLRRAELAAERTALLQEQRRGEFSSETLARMQRQLDVDEIQLGALHPDS